MLTNLVTGKRRPISHSDAVWIRRPKHPHALCVGERWRDPHTATLNFLNHIADFILVEFFTLLAVALSSSHSVCVATPKNLLLFFWPDGCARFFSQFLVQCPLISITSKILTFNLCQLLNYISSQNSCTSFIGAMMAAAAAALINFNWKDIVSKISIAFFLSQRKWISHISPE